jgi:hypothetical protein
MRWSKRSNVSKKAVENPDHDSPRALADVLMETILQAVEGPGRFMHKLVVKRTIKSGLMGGKKFEVAARVDSEADLVSLFKGFPDELVLAYKSAFAERSVSLRRSELLRGTRLSATSLNEIIEFEDRLQFAFEQLKRMIEIVKTADQDVVVT